MQTGEVLFKKKKKNAYSSASNDVFSSSASLRVEMFSIALYERLEKTMNIRVSK